jgi:hypothetical protein
LVKSFPAYLKKIEINGNFSLGTTSKQESQNSKKNKNGNSSEGETDELESECENQLGKNYFSHHRLRYI